jgi:hypothetical protein
LLLPIWTVSPPASQRVGVKHPARVKPNMAPCWGRPSIRNWSSGWANGGHIQALVRLGGAAGVVDVVDVGMGEPDRWQVQAPPFRGVQQALQISTGVDDGGVHRLVAPDDGAFLGAGGDGGGEVLQPGKPAGLGAPAPRPGALMRAR